MNDKTILQALGTSIEACARSRALFELLSEEDREIIKPLYIKHVKLLSSELSQVLGLTLPESFFQDQNLQ